MGCVSQDIYLLCWTYSTSKDVMKYEFILTKSLPIGPAAFIYMTHLNEGHQPRIKDATTTTTQLIHILTSKGNQIVLNISKRTTTRPWNLDDARPFCVWLDDCVPVCLPFACCMGENFVDQPVIVANTHYYHRERGDMEWLSYWVSDIYTTKPAPLVSQKYFI